MTVLPSGVEISDPVVLEALANRAKDILGRDWLEAAIAGLGRYPLDSQPLLLTGFSKLEEWLSKLRGKEGQTDVQQALRFAMLLWLICNAGELTGNGNFYESLRGAARREDWQAFFDTLFEAEVGVYWANQSIGLAEFGPPRGNPDLWLECPTPLGVLRMPTECKRISPLPVSSVEQDRLCTAIREWIEDPGNQAPPLKVSILLRRPAVAGLSRWICDLLRDLINQIKAGEPSDQWQTVGDPKGSFQVSACSLGAAAEWQESQVNVDDIDLEGSVQVNSQVDRTADGKYKYRVKSIVSVNSDLAMDRVGGLAQNVSDAMNQLAKLGTLTMPGIIAIRIRPPRTKGDLLEADLVVRQTLLKENARHVAMAVLFWNEAENVGSSRTELSRENFAVYHIKSYFIVNTLSGLYPAGLDSQKQYFPTLPAAIIRDPLTGALLGTTQSQIDQLRTGDDLDASDSWSQEDLSEESDSISLLFRLREALTPGPGGRLIRNVQAGGRQFRISLDGRMYVRAIEIRDGHPVRSASIDMRAWIGSTEFLFYLIWNNRGFSLKIAAHEGRPEISAESVPIRAPVT